MKPGPLAFRQDEEGVPAGATGVKTGKAAAIVRRLWLQGLRSVRARIRSTPAGKVVDAAFRAKAGPYVVSMWRLMECQVTRPARARRR